MIRVAGVALGLAFATIQPGGAQTAPPGTFNDVGTSYFAAGFITESYTFDDRDAVGIDAVSLWTVPLGARIGLGSRARIDVTTAWARGELTASDGTEFELSGLTDTQASLTVAVVPGTFTLTGVVLAPTGSSTQTETEAVVAGVVSADLLPFAVSNWGTGGGFGVQATGTRRFGGFGAGLSVGWTQAGEFEPLDGETSTYRPGNELRVRLALDTEVGPAGKASLVVGFQRYSEDEFQGTNLFQSGNRLEALATYAAPVGLRTVLAAYGGLLHRENGQYLLRLPANVVNPYPDGTPSQDLLVGGLLVRQALGGGWLTPRADIRAFRSEDGVGQGWVGSVGLAYEIRSGSLRLTPSVKGRLGNIEVAEGQSSGMTGVEAGLTVRMGR
jgi:hypothetical protein